MTTSPIPRLLTLGTIAERLGQPIHRIRHIITTRQDINPSALAGRTRLYDNAAMARIRHELNHIDAQRGESNG